MVSGRRGEKRQEQQAFALKGTMPAMTMLCLRTADVSAIERQLEGHISQMPHFFLHLPILLDLDALGDEPVDLGALAGLLRKHNLVPIAVRNPTDAQRERAVAAGLGVLRTPLTRSPRKDSPAEGNTPTPGPVAVGPAGADRGAAGAAADRGAAGPARRSRDAAPAPDAAGEPPPAGLTLRQPVRSGQVIYVPHGDLVVLSPVSSGAELIANDNIHVYAPLRGRAMAGAHNNADASIFCMSLEAEFVSIAGRYLMADEIPDEHRGKPARISVQNDGLVITRL
ncbi:septum site-determining protein MinC [Sorangium sp. So ce1014]|uniref:septum site-determining protein MinC n=1 Tax=Sorangium sp. So ce1014 TaxID=3133326 RepID=UPI003F61ADC8